MDIQTEWGPLLAWDMFLAGAGAGAYLISILAERLGGRLRPLARIGIYAGPVLVLAGAILLLLDLGQPLRFWRAFVQPTTSMLSLGIYLISLFLVLGFVHILALLRPGTLSETVQRWLGTIAAVLAVGVMLYPALLVGLVRAIPFWNSPLLPFLYLLSALTSGAAVIMLLAPLMQRQAEPGVRWTNAPLSIVATPPAPAVRQATRAGTNTVHEATTALLPWTAGLIVAQLLALFFQMFLLNGSHVVAASAVDFLVAGEYALTFWVGVVLVGLLIPLALVLWAERQRASGGQVLNLSLLIALCLLIGGIALRYAILAAGFHVSGTL